MLVMRELKTAPEFVFAFALIALMVSAAYAQSGPPTLLWSDSVGTSDIALSKDGNYVAVVSDSQVRFYSRSSSTPLWAATVSAAAYSVAISADGDSVAAGVGNNVYFWGSARTRTGNPSPTWTSHTYGQVLRGCLDVSDDGDYVLAGSQGYGSEPNVLYWAGARSLSGSDVAITWGYHNGGGYPPISAVDLSSNGDYAVVGTQSNAVAYWKNAKSLTGESVYSWQSSEPTGSVNSVAVSDDGNYVAAPSYNSAVLYWAGAKTLGGDPSSTWKSAAGYFDDLDMSSDGNSVIAGSTSGTRGVYFWAGATGLTGKPQSPSWTYVTTGDVVRVVIDRAGDYMAAFNDLSGPPRVYFFDKIGDQYWIYDPDSTGEGLSISGNGGTLAVGTLPRATAYLLDTGFKTPLPTPIPEYPLGLPLLGIFMIITYGLIRRRTKN